MTVKYAKKTILFLSMSFLVTSCENKSTVIKSSPSPQSSYSLPKITSDIAPSLKPLPTPENNITPPLVSPTAIVNPYTGINPNINLIPINPTASPSNSNPTASATPSATPSPVSSSLTGNTSDIKDLATFNGKIYDMNGFPLDNVTVTARAIDANMKWEGEPQLTQNGAYVFRNAPVGARIQITAKRTGWSERKRTEVLKSNLNGNPDLNIFDFGKGSSNTDSSNIYYLQDEPEITGLKINDNIINYFPTQDKRNNTAVENFSAGLRSVSAKDVNIDMNFSEPIMKDDFESYFRITSQKINNTIYTYNKNSNSIKFEWNMDSTNVIIRVKDILLANANEEYKYAIEFSNSFRDAGGLKAVDGKYFRVNGSKSADFYVFSVK
ncbi:MAG: hypothetical protein U0457_02380 [Candidatus Sericytochromatia bacterium]